MAATQHDLMFPSGELAIEGTLHVPDGDGRFPGVVICHPHPQYGGDMYNVIVATLARALRKLVLPPCASIFVASK